MSHISWALYLSGIKSNAEKHLLTPLSQIFESYRIQEHVVLEEDEHFLYFLSNIANRSKF